MSLNTRINLARCIIFGGGLKASPLQELCHTSVLNLNLRPGHTVLEESLSHLAEIQTSMDNPLSVRVVYGKPVPAPDIPRPRDGLEVSVMQEPRSWRGPAGVLLDACGDLPADANILVLQGAAWFRRSLKGLVVDHSLRGAEVTVAETHGHSPAGAYLIRRSALEFVPAQGFLDLKEQLLGKLIREKRRVHVHTLELPGVRQLRTLEHFLTAAQIASGGRAQWSIIDQTADVDRGALVVHSVVMKNARIGPGAVVARSIVLEGAHVPAGAEVIDTVIGHAAQRKIPGSIRSARLSRTLT